ncbi:hypothetical protein, conserved [Eimeria brunetti]|uniref:Myosin heavy chain n=1 Tax=Eimeria brunetti TaxID=51314 RepID=U6LR48_9EIME|nr:hypothetical protein, conserved [Eimeria brunetti]
MLPSISVSAAAGWLLTWGLLGRAVEAAISAASRFHGAETDSLGLTFISADQFFNEGSLEGEEGRRGYRPSPPLADKGSIAFLHANIVFPSEEGLSLALEPGDLHESDDVQTDETNVEPAPYGGKDKRWDLRTTLSTIVLFLVVCLGLLTTRSLKARAGRKAAATAYLQQLYQQQEPQGRVSELGLSERHQLEELERLHPLAAHLAGTVGTDESVAALWEFRGSIQKAKQVQRNPFRGSQIFSGSPEVVMKEALDEGVSSLSRLYEVARERGILLAQKIRRINDFPAFSEEELQVMGGYLGSPLAGLLEFQLNHLGSSLYAFIDKVEDMENELKQIKGFDVAHGRGLLATVAADVEFIRAAYEALEKMHRHAVGLKSAAVTALLSHFRMEQACVHRKCRDLLEQQRVLCKVERQRQLSLSDADDAALKKLDAVEEELARARQLLQTHREKIDQLRGEKDSLAAEAARQEANAVGQDLQALLETVGSSLVEITGGASPQDASQHEEVQRVLHKLTSRASREAATVADLVGSMQNEAKLQTSVAPPFMWMRQNQGHKSNENNTFFNPSVKTLATTWLQQVSENAELVAIQAANAATGTLEESNGSRASESLFAAARATMLAETLTQEAELLGLREQLLSSMEFEMHVSDILAQRAAAAAGVSAWVEDEQQHWRVSLSPQEILQVQALLEHINMAKEEAWSQRSLSALAVAAAAMKEASFKLISIVQGSKKQ